MKWIIGLAVGLWVWTASAAPGVIATNGVGLQWDYPTNALGTNQMLFKLYSSIDVAIPQTSWPLVKSVGSTTNRVLAGTNWIFTTAFPMVAEQRFFFVTASNFWGESVPSASVSTPAAPRSEVHLSIGLAP